MNSQNLPGSPMVTNTPSIRDNNGDIPMHDAAAAAAAAAAAGGHHDPYAGVKYPIRPHHQHSLSSSGNLGGSRSSGLHSPHEPSQAAQRYSPMEALSPTSPYTPYAPKPGQTSSSAAQYTPAGQQQTQRQSPGRPQDGYAPQNSPFHPQSPYYGGVGRQPSQGPSQQQQQQQPPPLLNLMPAGSDLYSPAGSALSPMDSTYGDHKSLRRPQLPAMTLNNNSGGSSNSGGKPAPGPVPEFKKLRGVNELRPIVNSQPPFRRANPEGGFISVSAVLYLTFAPCLRSFCVLFANNGVTSLLAPASSHSPPACDLPHLQPSLQIRVVAQPTESSHQAQQGPQERRLRQRRQRLHSLRQRHSRFRRSRA